ncbi:MAG: hypothetical protein JEY91_19010 [Spirochaetaceae bacterium]|nr:hypothetical protein [Spirochaetaceae bacterium]
MKKRTFFGTFFLGIFLLQNTAWAIEIKINDTREENFYIDVLKMILDKSGEEYSLLIENNDFSQARNIISLKEGETDVLYAGTSRELEEQLLPLLFPIMRGLISRRIFIINKNKQDLFDSVKSLDDLRLFEGFRE